MAEQQYLTIEQAAARLGMSVRYVRRLVAQRRIAFHRYGRSIRVAEADVEAFAITNRVEPLTATDAPSVTRTVAA